MSEYYFSAALDNNRVLCIAPLTERRVAACGEDLPERTGYFLFECDADPESDATEVIARLVSEEAALNLRDMLNMS